MDEFDLKILKELQADGRLTNVELADRIGLSPSPCLRRVRRLESEGIIENYSAQINRGKMGLGVTVFAEVKMERHTEGDAERFAEVIMRLPQVVSCHLVSGNADYLLEIVLADLEQYSQFVVRSLRSIVGLQSIHSSFVLEAIKPAGRLPLQLAGSNADAGPAEEAIAKRSKRDTSLARSKTRRRA